MRAAVAENDEVDLAAQRRVRHDERRDERRGSGLLWLYNSLGESTHRQPSCSGLDGQRAYPYMYMYLPPSTGHPVLVVALAYYLTHE